MDILLDEDGDLKFTQKGDLILADSVAQKIKIRLQWFLGEWRWSPEDGIDFYAYLGKNTDVSGLESDIAETIFSIDEIVDVVDVSVSWDAQTREGYIEYEAITDEEIIREEVRI